MTRDLYPHLPALTALNMDEMLRAFKLHSFAGVRQIAYWSLYKLVEQLSGFALEYDARVGTQGLVAASDWLLSQVTGGVNVSGHEAIPQSGPLLVVSNHPGLTDAMAIFATLRRDDLRIVAAERAILQLLPNIER
ncbi:MAG: 1-acyl-sn-glycerol-3-phosphate acyltransferase, partial [Anaerolineae bacterium]|nr:1-acyl-sn-glycerol-3-phosphate acyltransferase [Anaerolineae bacterium]